MKELKDLIKARRLEIGKTLEQIGEEIGVAKATVQRWESGEIKDMRQGKLVALAKALNVSPAYLMGWEVKESPDISNEQLIAFPIIGNIAAGYNGQAVEEHTGDVEYLPFSMLRGHSPEDFFVLRVSGDSMYPQLIDGDKVLVKRCDSVDSGSIAVMLFDGNGATVKRVNYVLGEDWLELIPINPDFKPRRIEGHDLEQCRVLGKVVKLIRDMD